MTTILSALMGGILCAIMGAILAIIFYLLIIEPIVEKYFTDD